MRLLAIDPGPTTSAYAIWDGERMLDAGKIENEAMLLYPQIVTVDLIVCEEIKCYGMPVGKEVFDTVFWTGRLYEHFSGFIHFAMMPRLDVKLHLCGQARAKDSNIICALKDRFGDKPKKGCPSPTYGDHKLKADEWQAFALAVTYYDLKGKTLV